MYLDATNQAIAPTAKLSNTNTGLTVTTRPDPGQQALVGEGLAVAVRHSAGFGRACSWCLHAARTEESCWVSAWFDAYEVLPDGERRHLDCVGATAAEVVDLVLGRFANSRRTTSVLAQEFSGFEPAVRDLVWEMLDDLCGTYWLAMSGRVDPDVIDEIERTAADFLANHYGDD